MVDALLWSGAALGCSLLAGTGRELPLHGGRLEARCSADALVVVLQVRISFPTGSPHSRPWASANLGWD